MGIRVNNGDAVGMIGNNFDTHPDYQHDLFLQVQQLARGIGDVSSGKADEVLERAYEQNWWHTEDKLAEVQDKFKEDDMINNTPGRGFKNYRRMEYDITKNPNGKGAEEDHKAAEDKKVLTKDEVVDLLNNVRYSICSTASAWGNEPIKQKDYQDQIKLR